eukprot:765063-Hanusia_phi.AAC.4
MEAGSNVEPTLCARKSLKGPAVQEVKNPPCSESEKEGQGHSSQTYLPEHGRLRLRSLLVLNFLALNFPVLCEVCQSFEPFDVAACYLSSQTQTEGEKLRTFRSCWPG